MPARPVYSRCFLSVQDVMGTSTYLVPPTVTSVLRNMTLWIPAGATPGYATVLVAHLDLPGAFVWDVGGSNIHGGVYQWEGREVFIDYLTIDVSLTLPFFSFRANGYELTAT
jgi:hypothetical protein